MPNNIQELKRQIKKRVKAEGTSEEVNSILGRQQRLVAAVVLNNLLRFTNVQTGQLAGGWVVRLRGSSGNKRASKNKTRLTKPAQSAPLKKITGKTDVTLVNSVVYARAIDSGTRYIRPSNFTLKAARAAKASLSRQGISIIISGAA